MKGLKYDFKITAFHITVFFIIWGLAHAPSAYADQEFYQSLTVNKRDEIKIVDDFTVEVSLGPDGRTVSSTILDAVFSIPSIDRRDEPVSLYVQGSKIFRRQDGDYTWDIEGKKRVRLTSGYINNQGGKIFVSVQEKNRLSQQTSSSNFVLKGFRSAHFGMAEKNVRNAIKKDFNISKEEINKITNKIEKTTSLIISASELLPDGGQSQIVYIFGYKSKKLIQVNIVWGKPVSPKPDIEALLSIANSLRNYFVRLGFPKDKMVANARINDNSILVFRGSDKKGRMASLLLNNSQGISKESVENNASLQLSYIENPDSPDIFLIKKGEF